MAIARELREKEDFVRKLENASPGRYELWCDGRRYALMPVVTSQNVHAYSYTPTTGSEEKEIEDSFDGEIIGVEEIIFGKW